MSHFCTIFTVINNEGERGRIRTMMQRLLRKGQFNTRLPIRQVIIPNLNYITSIWLIFVIWKTCHE